MRWRWRSSSLSRRTSSCDLGRETERFATPQPVAAAIIVGLIVAGLAFAFGQTTDESPVGVLLSGQDQLPGLVARAGTLSLSTLVLLIAFKGIAYGLCMITPAVAICMAAATVTILHLPLSSIVLAILLTAGAGVGSCRSSSSPSSSPT